MMENLPKGLVATSARIPSRLEAPNHVDAGDIARLWKGLCSLPMPLFLSISLALLLTTKHSLPRERLHPYGRLWSSTGEFLLENLGKQAAAEVVARVDTH